MKYFYRYIFFSLLCICCFSACKTKEKETILFTIPKEMHFVAPKLVEIYQKDHPNVNINIQELRSSELHENKKEGIFIADSWIYPIKKPFLTNPIVVIGKRKLYQLDELKGFSISIADPDYNSSGVSSIKILREAKLWDLFKRNISYQKTGINSMQAVDLQENDYGIVAHSDSIYLKNSFIVLDLMEFSDSTIEYQIRNYEKKSESHQLFVDFLHSPKALDLFKKYGFIVPKQDSAKSAPQT